MFERLKVRFTERRALNAFATGDYRKAEQLFRTLQQREGESQRVLRNLGLTRMALGDLAGAKELFAREMELYGPTAERLRALAEVAYLTGNRREAAVRIAEALAEPRCEGRRLLERRAAICASPAAYGEAMKGKSLFAEGNRLLAAGEVDRALAAFQQASELDPTDYAALNNVGSIQMNDKKDPSAAAQAFRQAYQLLELPMIKANLAQAEAMMTASRK